MQLKLLQQDFAKALLHPEVAPNFVQNWLDRTCLISSEDRLSVYRNNLFGSLKEVLHEAFPLTHKLIGEQAFKQVAEDYILEQLPSQACLFAYGAEFPAFLQSCSELMERVPYLSDVARYEWATHSSAIAADDPTLSELQSLTVDEFSRFQLILCSHVHFLTSVFPLKRIVDFTREDPTERMTYEKGTFYFLIYRDQGDVLEEELTPLFHDALCFLKSHQGASVARVTSYFLKQGCQEDLGSFIHFLCHHNLIKQP